MSAPWKVKATSSGNGGDRFLPPAGAHAAVLVGLIDLGTHEETYKRDDGAEKKEDSRKVLMAWELSGEIDPATKQPFVVTKDYNLTFGSKSNLRKLVQSWAGRELGEGEEFDLSVLLGKPCLVNVVHKTSANSGNPYAKVDSVGPLPKGMAKPKAGRPPLAWSVGDDLAALGWLPFLYGVPVADKVKQSAEYRGAGVPVGGGDADEGHPGAAQGDEDAVRF
jgi:hypothetical protein